MKGVDVMPCAVHVKGIEIGAHGTRSDKDVHDIYYATNVQGGDHTSPVAIPFRFVDRGCISHHAECADAGRVRSLRRCLRHDVERVEHASEEAFYTVTYVFCVREGR